MNNIERDEQRIQEYYIQASTRGSVRRTLSLEDEYGWFTEEWFTKRYAYIRDILDLSEEFHRKYCKFYLNDTWRCVFLYQTKVSEQFYDDFFDKMDSVSLADIIRRGSVSIEWIERNKHRISSKIWEQVYE